MNHHHQPNHSRNALLIAGEIARVLASIRSSKRWTSSRSTTEEEVEDDISEALKSLRRDIFTWEDWSFVEPLEYLIPFLEVVKSPETTAIVTDIALTSLLVILNNNILGDSSTGIYDAVQGIAESVTQCKFEATYPAFDECVLNRILDVLVTLVRSPQGHLLAHDNLINIFQACYRIGHYQTEKGRETSEMLTQSSRRAMHALVSKIFSRLDELVTVPTAKSASKLMNRYEQHATTERRLQVEVSMEDLTKITVDGDSNDSKGDNGISGKDDNDGDKNKGVVGDDSTVATTDGSGGDDTVVVTDHAGR